VPANTRSFLLHPSDLMKTIGADLEPRMVECDTIFAAKHAKSGGGGRWTESLSGDRWRQGATKYSHEQLYNYRFKIVIFF
jgi:hypothetical protein